MSKAETLKTILREFFDYSEVKDSKGKSHKVHIRYGETPTGSYYPKVSVNGKSHTPGQDKRFNKRIDSLLKKSSKQFLDSSQKRVYLRKTEPK